MGIGQTADRGFKKRVASMAWPCYKGVVMFSPILERWLQADPAGFTAGMDIYQMELSDPLSHLDPRGRQATTDPTSRPDEQSNWSRKLDWGPRLLDGRAVSYDIGFFHVVPTVPKGVTQLWQVVRTVTAVIPGKKPRLSWESDI